MGSESKIAKAFKRLNNPKDNPMLVSGIVVSVDWNNKTCKVKPDGGGASYPNVRLRSAIGSGTKGLYVKPSVNSPCIIGLLMGDDRRPFLIGCDEYDTLYLNGDQYEGLVKVANNTQKLNNLENKVNEILGVLQGIVIPLAPSGTYPFAPLFAGTSALTPTVQADIENPIIKHG